MPNKDPDFDWLSRITDHHRNKSLTLYELRFQLAIIIFPTIIGLWGFIGLIITSTLFEKYPIFMYIVVNIGIFFTILLIWYWRERVHRIFEEEMGLYIIGVHIEGSEKLYHGDVFPNIENIIRTLHQKVRENYPEFYKKLTRIQKCNFYMKYRLKLSNSGYESIDMLSQISIYVFWAFWFIWTYIFFSIILMQSQLTMTILDNWIFSLIITVLSFSFISTISYIFIKEIKKLKDSVTLTDFDIEDYCCQELHLDEHDCLISAQKQGEKCKWKNSHYIRKIRRYLRTRITNSDEKDKITSEDERRTCSNIVLTERWNEKKIP
jgi:hypothetical protein